MKKLEFACPNCLHSGLLFEKSFTVMQDVFDIVETDGKITNWKLDKELHSVEDQKISAFCSKCGTKVGVSITQQGLLDLLLNKKCLIESDEGV